MLLDITASSDARDIMVDIVTRVAESIFIPFTVGGGIRTMDTVRRYLEAGASRVILGTAAVTDRRHRPGSGQYGGENRRGRDLKDGKVAIKGWLETSQDSWETFFDRMQALGVRTVICTDISRDGAMRGANLALYRTLASRYSMDIIASGGCPVWRISGR